MEEQRQLDAPRRKGGLSLQAQCEQKSLLLGTAVAVDRDILGAAGPSPAEKSEGERVLVEDVNDEDDDKPPPLRPREYNDNDKDDNNDDPPPLLPREGIASPLLDGCEGKSDACHRGGGC